MVAYVEIGLLPIDDPQGNLVTLVVNLYVRDGQVHPSITGEVIMIHWVSRGAQHVLGEVAPRGDLLQERIREPPQMCII